MLLEFLGCDTVELRIVKAGRCFRCEATCRPGRPLAFEMMRWRREDREAASPRDENESDLEALCRRILHGRPAPSVPGFTKHGSFWTGNLNHSLPRAPGRSAAAADPLRDGDGGYPSRVVVPLAAAGETIGLLQLKSRTEGAFREEEINLYEKVAQTLGPALVNHLAHADLRERIKELTCLYALAQLAERPHTTLEEILQGVVELLPPAWQYPDITAGRIVLDGRCHATANFMPGAHRQSADIVVSGERRGGIDVVYMEERPELDEGPFLKEERSLIDAVARQIALIVERRQADEQKVRLQDQLRHADRLATIGQLAAGVAHELNEPLGNILAFAQLVEKQSGLPEQAARDLGKIVNTSLHAREIVKKLMLFARQMPPQKTQVDLNAVVQESLDLLDSRCAGGGVAVVRHLSQGLPEITADAAQLNQVMVNLVVNAIQAMPGGGTLTVATRAAADQVVLRVEDNGVGMSDEVLRQVFLPFFTTKDVHEGTGLGLPVVHGIVNSHGGTIDVESTPGRGARFEVRLPVAAGENHKDEQGNDIA